MNCLVNVKIIRDGMKRNGVSILLNSEEFKEMNQTLQSVPFVKMSSEKLHVYFNKDKTFDLESFRNLFDNPKKAILEIIEMGNPQNYFGVSMAHLLASNGFIFPFKVLMKLPNYCNDDGVTIAHCMANSGHKFSIYQLVKLGNPTDNEGNTISSLMIRHGHEFSSDDLLKIGISKSNG